MPRAEDSGLVPQLHGIVGHRHPIHEHSQVLHMLRLKSNMSGSSPPMEIARGRDGAAPCMNQGCWSTAAMSRRLSTSTQMRWRSRCRHGRLSVLGTAHLQHHMHVVSSCQMQML